MSVARDRPACGRSQAKWSSARRCSTRRCRCPPHVLVTVSCAGVRVPPNPRARAPAPRSANCETRAVGHVHVHAPHALTEKRGGPQDRPARSERVLEIVAILLMSVTTVATAWSGYQAARWSGEQSQSFAAASGLRIKAQQQTTAAGQTRIDDLLYFNGWLDAYQSRRPGARGRVRTAFPAGVRAGVPRLARPAAVHQPAGDPRAAVHAAVPAGRDRRARRSSTRKRTSCFSRGHPGADERRQVHPVDGVLRRGALLRGHLAAAGGSRCASWCSGWPARCSSSVWGSCSACPSSRRPTALPQAGHPIRMRRP